MVCPSIQSSIPSSVSIPPSQPAASSSLCIHPSLCSCIRSPFFIHLPVFTSTQPPIHSSIHRSTITSMRKSIHPTCHQLHPSIIQPPIFNLHLSICPFVFQSIYPLPVHPAVLFYHPSLVITHSLSSLICAEPALHGVLRISRGTSSQPVFMECRYWCVCRRKQPSCVHSHFSNQITVHHLLKTFKSPHSLAE